MRAAVVDARGRVCYYLYQHACMRAAVVDARRRANSQLLRQHACSGRGCACVFSFVPACMQQSWMRVGMCVNICACWAVMRGRVYYHLCNLASCVQTPNTQQMSNKHEKCKKQSGSWRRHQQQTWTLFGLSTQEVSSYYNVLLWWRF